MSMEKKKHFEKLVGEYARAITLQNTATCKGILFEFVKDVRMAMSENRKSEEIWKQACKAQMDEVYNCIPADGNTNAHAIKHWTKTPIIPDELINPQQVINRDMKTDEILQSDDINLVKKHYKREHENCIVLGKSQLELVKQVSDLLKQIDELKNENERLEQENIMLGKFAYKYEHQLSESNTRVKDVAIGFAGFIRNEINADRLRHYDPTENGKWAYWKVGNGGIAKQLTTSELFDIYLDGLK